MSLNFDPNASSLGPVQGPSFVPPTTGDETDTHDPTASTISQSLAEALMVQYLMGWPVLQQPNDNGTYTASVEGITAMAGVELSKIGADMWDSYMDHLAEEKERIAEYLNSPAFRQYVEDRTLRGQVQTELNTNVNTQQTQVFNATDFNQYINSRIISATELWTNTIDGVSNYIQQNKEANPEACLFVAASFAITATYIGDYLNIVDVASTNMVSVNPVQDAVQQALQLIPPQVQEQFTISINLLAIGLINFANAEAIAKGGEQQRPPMTWDTAVALSRSILASVQGNVVNGFLLAMLINKLEHLGSTEEQRNSKLEQLNAIAKAIMLAIAAGALLKAAMPDVDLTADDFSAVFEEPLVPQSEMDQRLVNELSPLVSYFNSLREQAMFSNEGWKNLVQVLGHFFSSNPDFHDIFSSTQLMQSLVKNLLNPDFEA